MKGVSVIVASILLLLMTISGVLVVFLFLGSATDSVQRAVEDQQKSSGIARIERIENGSVYILNSGRYDVEGLLFYVNGLIVDAAGPEKLPPGQVGVYVLDPSRLGEFPDVVEIKVTTEDSVDILTGKIR